MSLVEDRRTRAALGLLDDSVWQSKILLEDWAPGSGGDYGVIEPATGREIGRLGLATPSDVREAAQIAKAAQWSWSRLPYDERAAVMRRAGDLWEQYAEDVASWLIRESGSTLPKAGFETTIASHECYEAASLAAAAYGELLRSSDTARLSFSRRMPVGVVGVIAPFNAPIILSIRAVAPALALGNAVILKPDPRTGVSGGVALGRIFQEAGLPAGLLTVLPGGADVGEALVADPDVSVIAFTGSTRGGRAVAQTAAKYLKRVHLELGGNSSLIVLPDVDVEAASAVGAFGSYFHQGQICMATSRHLVHESIADEYVAALATRARRLTAGDPAIGPDALGPIIDAAQRDNIHRIVTSTLESGATLAAGGTYEDLFYAATVLSNVPRDSAASVEEIFGPVAPVITFSSLDEVVDIATDTDYGLSLGILSRDVMKALELAERIPAGLVHINDQTINDEATAPFGGVGNSGTGSRHGGTQANLEAFTEIQWTTIRGELIPYPF